MGARRRCREGESWHSKGMRHEGVHARMEELSGREGRQMSDLPIHPSTQELSCKKPERLKKRRKTDR